MLCLSKKDRFHLLNYPHFLSQRKNNLEQDIISFIYPKIKHNIILYDGVSFTITCQTD